MNNRVLQAARDLDIEHEQSAEGLAGDMASKVALASKALCLKYRLYLS